MGWEETGCWRVDVIGGRNEEEDYLCWVGGNWRWNTISDADLAKWENAKGKLRRMCLCIDVGRVCKIHGMFSKKEVLEDEVAQGWTQFLWAWESGPNSRGGGLFDNNRDIKLGYVSIWNLVFFFWWRRHIITWTCRNGCCSRTWFCPGHRFEFWDAWEISWWHGKLAACVY